jgi:beta-glucosidase
VNDKLVVDDWNSHSFTKHQVELDLKAETPVDIRVEYFDDSYDAKISFDWIEPAPDLNQAVELAKKSDAAVVVVGWPHRLEGEDTDRASLTLPGNQENLIEAVAAVNPRTIVVVQSGGPVVMGRWKNRVAAILQAWYFGERGGYALADILLGRANPSGKLPVTFPRARLQAADGLNYPGKDLRVEYQEGLLVGYRFFDQYQIEPEFPFGFGLSYTDFKFHTPTLKAINQDRNSPLVQVSVPVQNVGRMMGSEVVQVYVRPLNPIVFRPPKELKGFKKIQMTPGERHVVQFDLDARAFSHFDETAGSWVVPAGSFEILVGNSSASASLKSAGNVTLQ